MVIRNVLIAGLCLSCLALIALAVALGASPASGAHLQAELPVFGVAVGGEWFNSDAHTLVRQSGAAWARTSVRWDVAEPEVGVFNWADADKAILAARQAGTEPIMLVYQNPSWAASTNCGPIDQTPNARTPLENFYDFVYALADRYDGSLVVDGTTLRVDYWEFYNEPDQYLTFSDWLGGCWGDNGADYARMLEQAWSAVHAVNAQAKVVFGAVAAEDVWNDAAGSWYFSFDINGGDFVDTVLTYVKNNPRGPNQYFDFFNIHYFPAFHIVWDPYGAGLEGKTAYYRNRMSSKGLERPLICSEAGRRSDPRQVIDGIPGSDEEQSRYVVRLNAQAMAANLTALTWFNLSDFGQPGQIGFSAWGLLDSVYQPKPSYNAYKTLTQQLGMASFVTKLSSVPGAELYVFSVPSVGSRSVIWSSNAASYVDVTFLGSIVYTLDKWGTATVYHDGQSGDLIAGVDGRVKIRITGSPIYADGRPDVAPTSTPTPTGRPQSIFLPVIIAGFAHPLIPLMTPTPTETATVTSAPANTPTFTETATPSAAGAVSPLRLAVTWQEHGLSGIARWSLPEHVSGSVAGSNGTVTRCTART